MNVEDRVVHVARPSPPPGDPPPVSPRATRRKKASVAQEADAEGNVFLDAPFHTDAHDVVLKSGWHQADSWVRPVYGEDEAYHRLT